MPHIKQRGRQQARDLKTLRARIAQAGLTYDAIARSHKCSWSMVYKVLHGAKISAPLLARIDALVRRRTNGAL